MSTEQTEGRGIKVLLRDAAEAIVLAVVLFLVLQLLLQSTVVEGQSMAPNFADGEWVLVDKMSYRWRTPERGEVIVFHAPGEPEKDYIKRVVGLPGEEVHIRDRQVFVDGQPIEEPWLPIPIAAPIAFGPEIVPPEHVFVLGDNRPNSNDSRTWVDPWLSLEEVVGPVRISLWPLDSLGLVRAGEPRHRPDAIAAPARGG